MNKLIKQFSFLMLTLLAVFACTTSVFAQTEVFEDKNISITSKLPPQWLGYRVHVGSDAATVPFYYKVSAVVPGIGETKASPVTTAYAGYGPISSTMALRIMWAPVPQAAQYKLYKSADNSTFYLQATVNDPVLTYVDEGAAAGAAYSAPTPKGGNLTVENDLAVGDDVTVAGDLTVTGGISFAGAATAAIKFYSRTTAQLMAITPAVVGQAYYDSDRKSLVVSTGTSAGNFARADGSTW